MELRHVLTNPSVQLATIHDVDNKCHSGLITMSFMKSYMGKAEIKITRNSTSSQLTTLTPWGT